MSLGPDAGRRAGGACALVAVALLAIHFGRADVRETPIHTDVRYFLAGGKLIAGGAVPYRDFAETKPPLAPLLGAALERGARAVGVEGIVAVRVGFLLVAAAGGLLQFAILRRLGGGCGAGLLGVLAYTGFSLLRSLPEIGTVPKLLMGVLASAAALLAYRRRWALAGACAALAALDWQVGGLALVGVLVVAATEPSARRQAVVGSMAGAALVFGIALVGLALAGALDDAWRQAAVANLSKGFGGMGRHGLAFRLGRIAKTLVPGASGQLWLVGAGALGAAVFAIWLWRVRRLPERRLAWPLAVYHYGIVLFSFVDFQGFGDLLALFASLAFFAGVTFAEVLRLGDAGVALLARARPERSGRLRSAFAVVAVAAMALVVRPGFEHPDSFLGRSRRRVPTLGAQRSIAGELVERVAGLRVGFVGCAEMMYLTEIPNRLPLVRWNPPIQSYFRRSSEESSSATLERLIADADLEAIVCPDHGVRRALMATGRYERVVLGSELPPGARVFVLLRRDRVAEPPTRPYSAQLHVHGSFSEGAASIDSHSFEASDVGADVVWWSDHDFRISSYHHASRFGFEGWTEPLDRDEPWSGGRGDQKPGGRAGQKAGGKGARKGRHGEVKRVVQSAYPALPSGSAEITADAADEGEHSLRVRASNPEEEFAAHLYHVEAARGLFKRPLAAGVTLHLSVFPEVAGADARPTIEIGLSEHAPRDGVPLGEIYRLVYVLDNDAKQPERVGGSVFVPIAYRPGAWNRLVLHVTEDAIRNFPEMRGEDNAFGWIAVGISARRGATGAALFDRLSIEQETSGDATFERQEKLIDSVAAGYPALRELQGVEISYTAQHLNEFSLGTRLIDYDALLGREGDRARGKEARGAIARRAVDVVHARGGLVSYNHMFGAARESGVTRSRPPRVPETKEAILAELWESRVFGADILEVGYRQRGGRPLEDHLWVWDELGRRGLFLVGTGVSDSHGGVEQRWRSAPNNFLSWIYARSPEKADLIDGMRAGRVFFGDIVLFDGSVDLVSAHGHRMGRIVVTDRSVETVTIEIDGLVPGDVLDVIESGRKAATIPVQSSKLSVAQEVHLDPSEPTIVRVEVRTADGVAKVLSNPIVFVRAVPEGGLDPARAALDLGGMTSERVRGFRLSDASVSREGDSTVVALRGRAAGGVLDLRADGADPGGTSVALEGLTGNPVVSGDRISISDLSGEGTIRLTRRR